MPIIKAEQKVKIKSAKIKGREKLVPKSYEGEHKIKEFLVLSVPNYSNNCYTILIEDNMVGWTIDLTHLEYQGVSKKYLGKKFFDVSEDYFIL